MKRFGRRGQSRNGEVSRASSERSTADSRLVGAIFSVNRTTRLVANSPRTFQEPLNLTRDDGDPRDPLSPHAEQACSIDSHLLLERRGKSLDLSRRPTRCSAPSTLPMKHPGRRRLRRAGAVPAAEAIGAIANRLRQLVERLGQWAPACPSHIISPIIY